MEEIEVDSIDIEILNLISKHNSPHGLEDVISRAQVQCPRCSFERVISEFEMAIQHLRSQIQHKLSSCPPPSSVNFCYFGLSKIFVQKKPLRTQLCLSGGALEKGKLMFEGEDVTYFPNPAAFDCPILEKCDEQTTINPSYETFLDYFLILGICILLVREAFPKQADVRVFVGFDSGDSFEIIH